MNRFAWIIPFLLLISFAVKAQNTDTLIVPAKVLDGDTMPYLVLDEITINPLNPFADIKNKPKFSKLIRDVKKVYPYAVISGIKLKEYNEQLAKISNETEKKVLMKKAEEDIKAQFSKDIEDMTRSQGRILLKLIFRQTGVSSYAILKELRGSLTAFFYQGIARLNGVNLKSEYDPKDEDKAIEEIVKQIENGSL
jgi:Domain of unknown function (DUF4294)